METHGHPMCIHVTAATRALLGEDGTGWADYGRRIIKGASCIMDYSNSTPSSCIPLLLDYGRSIIKVASRAAAQSMAECTLGGSEGRCNNGHTGCMISFKLSTLVFTAAIRVAI